MADNLWEFFAIHIEATLDAGKWVRLHFGNQTRDIVGFKRNNSHPLLAWVETNHDGDGLTIDVRSIYAYEDLDPLTDGAA